MSSSETSNNISKVFIAIGIVVVLGIIGIVVVATSGAGGNSSTANVVTSGNVGTNVGDIAPDFTIKTIDGQTISLADFRDNKALLITSTASWCPTCVIEAEEISPVYPLFQDDVEFLSVSIDPTDDRLKLEGFRINNNTPWFYTEPKLQGVRDMIITYRFNRFEMTYIIDKDGVIRFKDNTITSTEVLRDELEKLTAKKQSAKKQKVELGKAFSDQGQEHIEINASHPAYNSNPPTSGWHYEEPAQWSIYNKELPDEQVVHNLEHGGIWISYQPDIGDDQIKFIEAIASQYLSKVITTPRAQNDAPVAIAAWTRLLTLDTPLTEESRSHIMNFIEQYKNRGPEFIP